MSASAASFAAYARAVARGEGVPSDILELVGAREPTPYEVLRRLVPRSERRDRGTFFTSSETATHLWSQSLTSILPGSVIVDPACGAGDLLIPAARHIEASDIKDVIFRTCDIDADFTDLAATLLRRQMPSGNGQVEAIDQDFMLDDTTVSDATHVVLNPPFIPITAQEDWAAGNINAAALFVIRALKAMKPGAQLLALLPDVLRSGSRYTAWRSTVESLASVDHVEVLGVFDEHADVHVFTTRLTVGATGGAGGWHPVATDEPKLADYATIRVGPVVPHRDREEGPLCDYVTARSLTSGESLQRRYSGRKERGHLVLVNRTSRPGEQRRIRARIWSADEALAVENHLLVVSPKDGKLSTCHKILAVLSNAASAQFLDERIRLRHLTVRALSEIPWRP
jgi:hypothetical protein